MELKPTLERIVPQTRIILSHQNRNFNTLPNSAGPPPSTSPATMDESSLGPGKLVVNRVARHVPVPCVGTTSIDESLAGLTEADRQVVSLKTFALPQFLELR